MAACERGGRDYLERHGIPELLRRLSALLLYHQPERPRQFLIQVLERVKAGRQGEGGYPCLMDESNLVAMFQMLDVADLGYITPVQYREGQSTPNGNQLSTDNLHIGDDVNITLDTFKEEVKKRLLEIWAAY
ncbi:EF-hand calcium-binding domain-containing protein 10 isoform X1 [Cygnus olor]|uniref:EF-hand calcium-binding domain-containing protein 10 isoform X1 n=1 Tax=Cygnus olor TaxID=8869 RepID=UPI001ADE47D0|nr:EF-hand calcium-binding domain-containing protein 10 isoform X1 [Cygnus olor]XP_040400549.1 EF-hand calcium-binding domain-containing protein 10 isoform X1 [Cygnus olor]